jgi:hypothetical protein
MTKLRRCCPRRRRERLLICRGRDDGPWSGITLVRLAVLSVAGIIVVLFATQWDRWVGLAVRQVTDDAYVRGDITPLSAHIEGYVRRVPVDEIGDDTTDILAHMLGLSEGAIDKLFADGVVHRTEPFTEPQVAAVNP